MPLNAVVTSHLGRDPDLRAPRPLHAGQAVDLAEQARKLAEILHPHLQVEPPLPVAPAGAAARPDVRILLTDPVGTVLEQVFAVAGYLDHVRGRQITE